MRPSTGEEDQYIQIHMDKIDGKSSNEIANFINTAFMDPIKFYQPLA